VTPLEETLAYQTARVDRLHKEAGDGLSCHREISRTLRELNDLSVDGQRGDEIHVTIAAQKLRARLRAAIGLKGSP
jgi:hypothetical protein